MISLIINAYFTILLSVGAASMVVFIIGLYFIFRKSRTRQPRQSVNTSTADTLAESGSAPDLSAIAGDDVISTQLDLARAYIETDKKQLAIKILRYVVEQGTTAQQTEAQQLLNHL